MDTHSIISTISNKLPRDNGLSANRLKEEVDKLDDTQKSEFQNRLTSLKLKDPIFIFWVGNALLGNAGLARYLIGDKVVAGIKLGLGLISLAIFLETGGSFVGELLGLGNTIWTIYDMCTMGKKIRQENLEQILSIIPKS